MLKYFKRPTITTLHVTIPPESKNDFADWQAELNAAIAGFDGFISLEFSSSSDQPNNWIIVQRFYNPESASLWRVSEQCLKLMNELQNLLSANGIQEITEEESNLRGGVTEVIVTQVSPDKEKAYREWSAKVHKIEAKFQGFRGAYIQSPSQSQGRNWITLLQFDTPKNLDRWLESSERQEVLKESASLITALETHRMVSPYAGWFASIAKTGEMPPVWKQTMIVLLVLFPIVMLELKYLSPWTLGIDRSLGTFLANALSVALISFPMMPIAIWFLGWWLSPGDKNRLQKTMLGTLIVLLLYLFEITLFWNFL